MERILIKNARAIVTYNPKDEVLYGKDILVEGKKIISIGENIDAPDAKVIDARICSLSGSYKHASSFSSGIYKDIRNYSRRHCSNG